MKKIYLIMMCILAAHSGLNAQCPAGRYSTEIFPAFTMDSVTYSDTFGLKMDIYQPAGDVIAARPLIIVAHGGSFIGGTREDDVACDSICWRFSKRGYVVASIEYRLGDPASMVTDSAYAVNEVIKAVSDGKAAIRYFVKDAATTNTYRIDTNNIFIGGNSAGAVLYMHVGYLDSLGECPSYVQAAMAANGGFEGNSGNAGYTTKSKAIISLAGGLNETAFVGPGDKPSVNCQGTADDVVPYTCGYPNLLPGVVVHVQLCGLGSLEPVYVANSIYHMSLLFPGEGHVPWDASATEYNSVDSIVNVFLYSLVCNDALSVNGINTNTEVALYPNPANEVLNVKSPESISNITVCDATGRMVFEAANVSSGNYEINTSRFSKGMYFVKVIFDNKNNTPQVRKIAVE